MRFTAGQSYPIQGSVVVRHRGEHPEPHVEDAPGDLRPRRFGQRWATASTTTSSTGLSSIMWSAGYRRLTGEAPMMPKWAYGLWQCRERYKSSQEILDVLAGFRAAQHPSR